MKPTGFLRYIFNKEPKKWDIDRETRKECKKLGLRYKHIKKDKIARRRTKRAGKHNFKEYIMNTEFTSANTKESLLWYCREEVNSKQ
jgi:hypothetical protein